MRLTRTPNKSLARRAACCRYAEAWQAMGRIVVACGLAAIVVGPTRAVYAQQPGTAGAAQGNDPDPTEASYRRAVEVQKRAKRPNDASVAEALLDLAMFYDTRGKAALEVDALREAQGAFAHVSQVDHNHYGGCLNRLANLLLDQNDYNGAEPLFLSAAAQYDQITGSKSVGAAFARANAAMILEHQGDYAHAQLLLEQAKAKFEATLGPNDPQIAVVLNHLAALYGGEGDVRAEATYQQLIAVHEQDGDAVALAAAVNDLATHHTNQGQWLVAAQEFKRALSILESSKKLDSAAGVKVLTTFATLQLKRGDLRDALPTAERAEAIAEAKLEPNNTERGYAAVVLADIYKATGQYRRAEALYLRAESVWRAAGGDDAPAIALSRINLGGLYLEEGDYPSAEQSLRKALDISRKAGDRGRSNAIAALNGLASLYAEQSKYDQAVPYAEEVLLAWQGLGAEEPKAGLAHFNLGQIYIGLGDHERARTHLERALAIANENSDVQAAAQAMLALAGLRNLMNDWVGAEAAYRAVIEQLKPFSSVEAKLATGHALGGLASLRMANADPVAAEDLMRQAIAAVSVAGPGSLETVAFETGLAQLLAAKKDFEAAELLLQRAAAALERAGGKDNPALVHVLFGKALVQWERADAPGAFRTMGEGLDIQERLLTRTLTMGSEEQRRLLLAESDLGNNAPIALHVRAYPTVPAAMRLAMLAVLRRKGRLLDTMSDTTRVLREHLSESDAALFDRLRVLRSTIARRALAGSGGDATNGSGGSDVESLPQEADALEAQIASRSAPFQAVTQPITIEGVAAAIPSDAALVEIVSFRPVVPHPANLSQIWGASRYVAYVLQQGGSLKFADLGEAKAIDDLAAAFRETLSHRGSDAKRAGRALDELVMRPVRQLVGNVRHLFISPDGALDVVPFAAMVDEHGHYLVDAWHISYLSSGRDLLRPKGLAPRSNSVVIANPSFGGTDTSSGGFGLHAGPLQYTEEEGRRVAGSLDRGELWLQAAASKSALMQVKGPQVLHIATHGFFLDDVQASSGPARDFFRTDTKEIPANPLLRSGLALAGANVPGGEGFLTALEASSLDLWGTKLVVLSACDTGVGEIRNGEGVFGLRRAFTMAGAASLVMSLWRVDDEGTRDLMTAYYAGLARGEGRAEALRNVQLTMSHSPNYGDPWHWASFVEYGEDGPLASNLPARSGSSGPPPVNSAAGRLGCGCSVVGSPSRNVAATLLSFALAALGAKRRKRRARVAPKAL